MFNFTANLRLVGAHEVAFGESASNSGGTLGIFPYSGASAAAHKEALALKRVRKRIKKHSRLSECGEESREHAERRAHSRWLHRR